MATEQTITATNAQRSRAMGKGKAAREGIAYHAAGEAEALMRMLALEEDGEEDDVMLALARRTTMRRLMDLNSVVLSVLGGDDRRGTDEMARVVYGDDAHAPVVHEASQAGRPTREVVSFAERGLMD